MNTYKIVMENSSTGQIDIRFVNKITFAEAANTAYIFRFSNKGENFIQSIELVEKNIKESVNT